ncbi:MAG: AMP-binding protein, partial [Actinomycetales bacterium]
MVSQDPLILWSPTQERVLDSQLWSFASGLASRGVVVEPGDYAALHAWSVAHPDEFWSAAAEFLGVRFHQPPTTILESTSIEDARWFPGATLNYAEHVLAEVPGQSAQAAAVIAVREGAPGEQASVRTVSRAQLRELVAKARTGLAGLGVGTGDVVAAMLPNGLEAIVGFLATASLGAIWTSCSPDFGPRAVIDRFGQLRPKVLLAVPGYRYGGKSFDITDALGEISQALPGEVRCVLVGSGDPALEGDRSSEVPGSIQLDDLLANEGRLEFTSVPFEHPLWTLFTSGTTGAPKGIIQGHGGIALEHGKFWRLHHDAGPGSRVFWFSTTGWMLWNLVATSLASGAAIVTYDGNPGYPQPGRLWNLVAEHQITHFGLSAPYVLACMKAQVPPLTAEAARTLTTVYSTGAPLPEPGFAWLQATTGPHVQVSSISGGTDLCTAFLGTSPWQPVWSGEMSCALLGA